MAMAVCVSMRMTVLFAMVMPGPMFMLMVGAMFMFMVVLMRMRVFVLLMLGANPNRVFSGQSAAAIFTHYSTSKEASSSSLPARNSPLGVWQSGQSANISSD